MNEAILATCQALMNAIMRLVAASRELQMEIVAAGKGGASPTEFYKRNHQWTEVDITSVFLIYLNDPLQLYCFLYCF